MKNFLKKSLLLALAALMVVFSLAACQNAGNGDQTGENTGSNVFRLGGIGPLTGNAASYGISVKQGAEIAIDEINAAGGVNGYTFELTFEDDANDAEKAVSAYNKLMDQDINALIGTVTSVPCVAVAEESVNDGILQITPSGSAQDCTKYDNGFRICFTDPLQGETMAQYIKDSGFNKTAIIFDVANDYSKGIKDAFLDKAKEVGLEVVACESFTSGDIDFKTQLTKIKSTEADNLFLPIYYTEAAYIAEQAKAVGVSLPYFGADGWDGIIKQLNGDTANIEGAKFLTPFIASSEKENIKKFVEAYQKKFNVVPDQFAADAYDAIYAIKACIESTNGDISNEALVGAMTKIKVDGVTGEMTFNADGEPNKGANIAIIQSGEYVSEN